VKADVRIKKAEQELKLGDVVCRRKHGHALQRKNTVFWQASGVETLCRSERIRQAHSEVDLFVLNVFRCATEQRGHELLNGSSISTPIDEQMNVIPKLGILTALSQKDPAGISPNLHRADFPCE